ncbi:MAG: SsrA-binding protein SmpB [Alphaproteobacteria bacterium]|nr:MAG: SsrA-binding protein SmpB [Alphaproteobacteria bacterium]
MSAPKKNSPGSTIAQNRKAHHNYFVEETLEAGLVLQGTEVKSLRAGKANIEESHAGEMEGALYIFNMNITPYTFSSHFNHEPRRPRKLLLHAKEAKKIGGAIKRKGYTLIPLSIYFNKRGRVKVALGLCKGKNTVDKRQTEKDRSWARDKQRLLRNKS